MLSEKTIKRSLKLLQEDLEKIGSHMVLHLVLLELIAKDLRAAREALKKEDPTPAKGPGKERP